MSAEIICDGCGKRAPMVPISRACRSATRPAGRFAPRQTYHATGCPNAPKPAEPQQGSEESIEPVTELEAEKMHEHLGTYIQNARAGKRSLREVARDMNVSHTFLFAVERGIKPLPESRWAALARAVPDITVEGLRAAAQADLARQKTGITSTQFDDLNQALARRRDGMDTATYRRLMKLLKSDE